MLTLVPVKTPQPQLFQINKLEIPFIEMNKIPPFIIGICGGPSCGKSTVVQLITKKFQSSITAFKFSNFYMPLMGNQ